MSGFNNKLTSIVDFNSYFKKIREFKDEVIIMMAVNDDASKYYTAKLFDFLEKILPEKLEFRSGMAGIFDLETNYSDIQTEKAPYVEYQYGNSFLSASSSGYITWSNHGHAFFYVNKERIELLGNRGLNICIFSKKYESIVDVISVDLCMGPPNKINRYTLDNIASCAEEGDKQAQIIWARYLRDELHDLNNAIFWMKKSYNDGLVSGYELYDLVNSRIIQDSDYVIKILKKSAVLGDLRSIYRLGCVYSDKSDVNLLQKAEKYLNYASAEKTYLPDYIRFLLHMGGEKTEIAINLCACEEDFTKHAEYVQLLFQKEIGIGKEIDHVIEWFENCKPNFNSKIFKYYIDALMFSRRDSDLKKLIKLYEVSKSEYVCKQLVKLNYNGLFDTFLDEYWPDVQRCKNNNCVVRSKYVLNSMFFNKYSKLILASALSSFYSDISLCIQYNVCPEIILDCDNSLCELNLPVMVTNNISDKNACIITRKKYINQLRGYSHHNSIFYIDDMGKNSILMINEHFNPDVNNSVVPSEYKNVNKNDYVSFIEENESGAVSIYKDGVFTSKKAIDILTSIISGKKIYDCLDSSIKWILPRWDNIGDVFKIASLIGSYKQTSKIKRVGIIVRDRLSGISKLFKSIDFEISLDRIKYDDIRTYILFSQCYDGKIRYCAPSWMVDSAIPNINKMNLYLPLARQHYDAHMESDRFRELMGVPNSSFFEKIMQKKHIIQSKKILLNPFGGWIFKIHSDLYDKILKMFNKISFELSKNGFSVYTNYNNKNISLLKSQMLNMSVCELAEKIDKFDAVVSVCTGLTDMVALTNVDLYVIYPNEDWSLSFSRREINDRNNIFEYIWDERSNELAGELVSCIKKSSSRVF